MRIVVAMACLLISSLFPELFQITRACAQTNGEKAAAADSLPPKGAEISAADRADLDRELAAIDKSIKELAANRDPKIKALLPDVQIYSQAVGSALKHNELFASADVAKAKELLQEGRARAEQLLKGESPWSKAAGSVLRGYVSKIDGSVQPYGLSVPETFRAVGSGKYRLDVSLHDRNEKLTELNFLDERRKPSTDASSPDTIVLYPYGRFCNGFKFAGEVDVLEALEAAKRQYRIDDDRITLRGFGMGGAGCWHLAVHYPDRWMVAVPAAGFVDTPQSTNLSEDDLAALPEWQRKLFHLYDCPDWAANLYHCATIAYCGQDDPQKQSLDIMEKALQAEGIALREIVAPGANHTFDPQSKQTINATIASIADSGGRDRNPNILHFVTYTLRYNRLSFIQIDGLTEHWQESRVDAQLSAAGELALTTKNVTDLTVSFPPGWVPFDPANDVMLTVDSEELTPPRVLSDRSWTCAMHRDEQGEWKIGAREEKGLRKRPGLQGPIDDAFMDSFIIVRPTGKPAHEGVGKWVQAEMDRAIRQWRSQFRAEARVKNDTAVTDEDIASANLILWGDPESNAVIKRIAGKLPIHWDSDKVTAGTEEFSAADHVPVMIYPNPLNPKHYVVLNSGFTFREVDFANNARQVPRLPDWAILDIRTPPDATSPGKIEAADFFGEQWELHPSNKTPDRRTAAMEGRHR